MEMVRLILSQSSTESPESFGFEQVPETQQSGVTVGIRPVPCRVLVGRLCIERSIGMFAS